jgi:hypothetical protein
MHGFGSFSQSRKIWAASTAVVLDGVNGPFFAELEGAERVFGQSVRMTNLQTR